MRHGSLFSGIGGFDLAAEWMGWENVFHCEWNPFGQKILHHYWPNAIQYHDIIKTDFSVHRGTIDILTGGFPCQPYSMAGKRLGKEDERHLWPHMLRAIREIRPRWVVGENVLGLVNWNGGLVFDEVQADLEAEGYEVQPYVLPAVAVDAPHRRDRVWFVAYSTNERLKEQREQPIRREKKQFERGILQSNVADAETTQNTLCSGRSHGEHEQERAEVWEQRDAGAGGADGIHLSKGDASDSDRIRLEQCEDSGEMGRGQAEMAGQRDKPSDAIEADGKVADATDTHGNGFNQRHGKHEEQSGEGGLDAQRDVEQGVEHGDAADASSESSQRLRFEQREFSESEQRELGGTSREMGGKWDAADAMFPRGRKDNGRGESKFFDKNGEIGNWETFPTQSPICGRDDGIPAQLDGITFSKWRNESIKGFGNAVVPQVVHQIFKAIAIFESQSHTHGSAGT
jgi:DNA (cytosine-5)-methyltransferase 1